jgi:hypothetical protein
MSFYNWETQTCTSNNTPNFQVLADNENGLQFKNKRDRKIINVDPKVSTDAFSSFINRSPRQVIIPLAASSRRMNISKWLFMIISLEEKLDRFKEFFIIINYNKKNMLTARG